MNEQELQKQQEEERRRPLRESFFASAQIGSRVKYIHSTAIYRYVERRNNTANSPINIQSRIGSILEVDASDVTLI